MSSTSALDWLMEDFATKTPGVQRALLASSDGLPIASATEDTNGDIETQAAIASNLFLTSAAGINRITGREGNVRQVCAEHDAGNLFVMSAGDILPANVRTPFETAPGAVGMLLAVFADEDSDPRTVGWAMKELIRSVSDHLVTATRHDSTPASEGQ